MKEFLETCEEVGVECHSEEEDWVYETRRKFIPLF